MAVKRGVALIAFIIVFMAGIGVAAPEMIQVKTGDTMGSFQMGSETNDHEAQADEKPVHAVRFTYSYWIGKYEVTFDDYDQYCVAEGMSKSRDFDWGRGNRPVIYVSWWDAIAYCNWLSRQQGIAPAYRLKGAPKAGSLIDANGNVTTNLMQVHGYRLPTEAEWEYAARGGQNSQGFKYSGSGNLHEVAIYWDSWGDANRRTQIVGQKKPNELGLYDMSGNVWEWCHDWYSQYSSGLATVSTEGVATVSPQETQVNPTGAASGSYRVYRGGSWLNDSRFCHVSCRSDGYFVFPDFSFYDLGFRVARTVF